MNAPIRFAVSPMQQARFEVMRAEEQKIQDRRNESVTTILAGQIDPATVAGWHIELAGAEIICTPPATTDTGPSLVA